MFLPSVASFAAPSATPARARSRSSAATVAETRAGVLYADTSALVKLVVREAESDELESALGGKQEIATSLITTIELTRAVARARTDPGATVADDWAVLAVLSATAEIPLTDEIRAGASTLAPVELRTLDAIHLASALTLGDDLAGLLTYDERLQRAGAMHELAVLAPA
jgi:predicted nucleic acid-binding protein